MITSNEFWDHVRGVRVEGNQVIVTMKGSPEQGNEGARILCQRLLAGRENRHSPHEPGGNLTALNKWS